jgi:hypothetical protein
MYNTNNNVTLDVQHKQQCNIRCTTQTTMQHYIYHTNNVTLDVQHKQQCNIRCTTHIVVCVVHLMLHCCLCCTSNGTLLFVLYITLDVQHKQQYTIRCTTQTTIYH